MKRATRNDFGVSSRSASGFRFKADDMSIRGNKHDLDQRPKQPSISDNMPNDEDGSISDRSKSQVHTPVRDQLNSSNETLEEKSKMSVYKNMIKPNKIFQKSEALYNLNDNNLSKSQKKLSQVVESHTPKMSMTRSVS